MTPWTKSFLISAAVLAVGLSGAAYLNSYFESKKPSPPPRLTRQQRMEIAQDTVNKGPVITSHKTRTGEVLLVKVPKMPEYGTKVEHIECVVWRDIDLKHTSISCPSDSTFDPSEIIRDTE